MEADEFVTEGGLPVGSGADSHISAIVHGIVAERRERDGLDTHGPVPQSVSTLASVSPRPSPLRPRRSYTDGFLETMRIQLINDAADRKLRQEQMELDRSNDAAERKSRQEQLEADRKERIEERREKAADRAHLTQMVASAVGGYFGSQEKERKRKRKSRAKRRRTNCDGVVNTENSSDGKPSSSSKSE